MDKIPWGTYQKTIKQLIGLIGLLWFMNNPAIALAEDQQASSNHSINISITTHLGENQTFLEGDVVSFLLSLDRDAYILIVYQDAAGNLVPLFPVDGQGWVLAGEFLPFPSEDMGLRFVVKGPFGQEKVWAFAASTPFPIPDNEKAMSVFADVNTLLTTVRGHGDKADISYGEAYTQLSTSKNP